ncbi:glutathione-regulated potassium-efflux system oxidoreductase KefF [Propionivibrio sp.]|uniref:glutathione-regulated potassium-efflux system oxidoreductase KefF n=1 Tax=Propionivibrio sp. TaxID=2212460 RepID=UPI0025D6C478|nr:glutathione-regulated potassium-efflux system oxidoreductase KefF [Propionivibrio sp.]MBK7356293.1 glutathione-regulated potassium-efflux system oxidoreductase KefF [Propionivibrio sp.]MBK8746166.1 glutathione-regulated potassium-efflux system oxidoreductase KefF [Propionivibrio sp.]MBK8894523.1 glutathione-regulated potassium-efflux system oxidoreductase KefF [Propionivibrio sp.]
MILIVRAHPYPQRSRAGRALLEAVHDLPDLEVRSLYDLYPDFDIDVAAEQAALARADLVVWLHPIYWYSAPAMLKHWFDVVHLRGWAYGDGGAALRGKHCLWVATTGGDASSFAESGAHQLPFAAFEAPIRQTAKFCGMVWEPPIVLHGANVVSNDALEAAANAFRERLAAWAPSPVAGEANTEAR